MGAYNAPVIYRCYMFKTFIQQSKDFFNWKKNPHTIFYLAIPLAVVGLGCHAIVAYLQWRDNGDWVYSAILLAGLILLMFGLWPVRKELKKFL